MNNFTLKSALAAMTLLGALNAHAQDSYITKAEKPFDFKAGKNYVVLYAPTEAVTAMGNKIIGNNNLDPTMERNQFYYWTTDWDKTSLVLTNVEEPDGKNSLGGSEYINMTPLYEWGGGSFQAKGTWQYDLSKVTNDMVLHIGLRDFGGVAPKFKMAVGDVANIKTNGFQLEANLGKGEADGDYVGVGSMGHDKEWYYLEVPVRDLVDENGDFGFTYNFAQPLKRNGAAVQLSFAKPQVSTATGVLEPGNTVKTYTITKLGSAMSVDGIWFYEKDATGISTVQSHADASQPAEVYNLSGQRMPQGQLSRGIYIVKTAQGTRKITVK